MVSILSLSGLAFHALYSRPTFEKWQHKTNPAYPPSTKVRLEIVTMLRGLVCSTLCPALSVWLANRGGSLAYCGVQPFGWSYLVASTVAVVLISDLWEFAYHYLGHKVDFFWNIHRGHHVFSIPSLFSVIADDPVDQFMRATPLLVMPLVAPINIDMMVAVYGVFFYIYGVYLHTGYEADWIVDAHHPVLNTAFQHYIHHARGGRSTPYHTGFFFKVWDNLASSTFPLDDGEKCLCVKCARGRGERSEAAWRKVAESLPDYSVMLQPGFWLSGLVAPSEEVKEK